MSLDVPELPYLFDWSRVREILADWFYSYQNAQNTVPAGTIAIFVGSTPPDGWLKCDGTEYPQNKFPDLYKAVGAESTPGNFVVPSAGAPPVGSIWIINV